ncbi:MAG: hypothetical protein K2X35_24585 [Bryobacteraceae bacterium]|nr:hypothetical protein [Bryobacteraceae bacterium]
MGSVIFAFLLVAAMVIALRSLKRLPAGEHRVVERLGRPFQVIGPGVNFVAPFIDRLGPRIDTAEQEVELNVRGYDTAGGQHAAALCLFRFRVSNPSTFGLTSLLDPVNQARVLANQAFANVFQRRSLAEILADPGAAGDAALQELDGMMAASGMEVVKVEVMHIEQSAAVPEDEEEDDLD